MKLCQLAITFCYTESQKLGWCFHTTLKYLCSLGPGSFPLLPTAVSLVCVFVLGWVIGFNAVVCIDATLSYIVDFFFQKEMVMWAILLG